MVLDGSYQDRRERERLLTSLATGCQLFFILCHCAEAVTRQRLLHRALTANAVSDGRWEIYLHQLESFDPPEELPAERLLVLDTDTAPDVLLARIETFLSGGDHGP